MSTELDPVAGQWYRHLDKGQLFVVIAVDEDAGVVEIQHFDGDLEEIDTDAWFELELELSEPPEDWTGPTDDVERDDLDYSETDMSERDWDEPLKSSQRKSKEDWEEEEEDEDEWDEGESTEDLYGDDPDR